MLNVVGHYSTTGPALLHVTDPFTVLGLVKPLRCPVVACWGFFMLGWAEKQDGKGQ